MKNAENTIWGQTYDWQKKTNYLCPDCNTRNYQECFTKEDGLIGFKCDNCGFADDILTTDNPKEDPFEPDWLDGFY